jgi:hypothetical protein
MRERRALLIPKRVSFWRARFAAWGEFAMVYFPLSGQLKLGSAIGPTGFITG